MRRKLVDEARKTNTDTKKQRAARTLAKDSLLFFSLLTGIPNIHLAHYNPPTVLAHWRINGDFLVAVGAGLVRFHFSRRFRSTSSYAQDDQRTNDHDNHSQNPINHTKHLPVDNQLLMISVYVYSFY